MSQLYAAESYFLTRTGKWIIDFRGAGKPQPSQAYLEKYYKEIPIAAIWREYRTDCWHVIINTNSKNIEFTLNGKLQDIKLIVAVKVIELKTGRTYEDILREEQEKNIH